MEKKTLLERLKPKKQNGRFDWLSSFYIVILALYPLRHIHQGLDLWDTGYSYANFAYMGMEHMDPMWLFSTYLANVVGHFLMMLPKAGSLAGMNFYTGLFVSAMALIGYFFCTKKLGISQVLAFVGEFFAISFCWCPTASLYNYLTYFFFLGGVVFLYAGLTENKKWSLFAAGVCLGANVLVRFANLAEAAMTVAVWAYGIIEALEDKKQNNADGTKEQKKFADRASGRTLCRTLWCLGGYLAALTLLFGYIHIRYGVDEYITGIQRLFAMTDKATDYKAKAMLMGVIEVYLQNLYWVFRIVIIVLVGIVFYEIMNFLIKKVPVINRQSNVVTVLKKVAVVVPALLGFVMLCWLYYRGFCSLEFYSYGAILRPGILALMLAMLIGVIRILDKKAPKEEKLISGILILVILLTSIGSNNGVYPSMNNLFVAAPYVCYEVWKFCYDNGKIMIGKLRIRKYPIQCILVAFLFLVYVQVVNFGYHFVFQEGTGAQDATATIENSEILKEIKMSPERAKWIGELNDYVVKNDLQDREVILYGSIPSLSYYLQMPSAFNPWSDLDSYSAEVMEQELLKLDEQMAQDSVQRPVVILDSVYGHYLEGGSNRLWIMGVENDKIEQMEEDVKWGMLVDFVEKNDYKRTFINDRFMIWE